VQTRLLRVTSPPPACVPRCPTSARHRGADPSAQNPIAISSYLSSTKSMLAGADLVSVRTRPALPALPRLDRVALPVSTFMEA
jgi:hypothetical protein